MPDSMVTVDAHQHYWQLQNFAYPWHKQVNLPQMNRDYLPPDILPQMRALNMQHSILIQADNSLEETRWMLELAQQYPHIAGVVGWVDMAALDVAEVLAQLAQQPLFKGIRLMPAPQGDWSALGNGLHALATHDLVCDVLPHEGTLPLMTEMMRAHAETRFVVNHLAGQALIPGGVTPWTEQLKPLAALPNVYMKFSAIQGLAEPSPITVETLRPYLASAVALFGAQRLLFASDWPVSTLSGPYTECIDVMRSASASLSPEEQAWIWGKTAMTVYRLALRA
jgi:L-fucono-1,5-lactonase